MLYNYLKMDKHRTQVALAEWRLVLGALCYGRISGDMQANYMDSPVPSLVLDRWLWLVSAGISSLWIAVTIFKKCSGPPHPSFNLNWATTKHAYLYLARFRVIDLINN